VPPPPAGPRCAGRCVGSAARRPPISRAGLVHLGPGDAASAAAIVVVAALLSAGATRALIPFFRRRGILDRPNARSSHAVATPRGGGIAVTGSVLLIWAALGISGRVSPIVIGIVLGTLMLAIVSWIDDLRGLAPALRLAAHGLAVAMGLFAVPQIANRPFAELGPALSLVAVGLCWVWWINLFNFMDGIDGLAASEAAAISLGLLLFAGLGVGLDPALAWLAAAIFGAAIGFLAWNWSPARIFLGDVGSTTLGYLTGFLLLGVAGSGYWQVALVLPLYFLADATITLGRRLLRGDRFWQAHREHFYQLALGRGLSHAAVTKRVIAANLLLILCGWAGENGWGAVALESAILLVAVLLAALAAGR
jgi:UDP-N-acetylmuramyl pentapeptide phosphotransferase/UDP-N-acetylglucosamine-1-phosphate transferase